MKHVGLIAGGFKPFTSGHYHLVEIASMENDIVYLFVSNKDRVRKGEYPIFWPQMKLVWDKILKPNLPKNVKVVYTSEPTTEQLKILEQEEKNMSSSGDSEINYYTLYADPEDMKRYDNPRIKERLLGNMFKNHRITLKPVERTGEYDVSGTKARKALEDGNVDLFVSMMPKVVKHLGHEIFDILKNKN